MRLLRLLLIAAISAGTAGCCREEAGMTRTGISRLVLNYDSRTDPGLQKSLEQADDALRGRLEMPGDTTAVGVLDLRTGRLAMLNPDKIEYAASVPKIAILLAWFQRHPEAAGTTDRVLRHELGLMVKVSDNDMATKYSRQLGLPQIQDVLNRMQFYDAERGGGLWMGKHYGTGEERYRDPVGGNTHAATVRQLLRFYLLLEQGRLVSPEASQTIREIFASPEIAHLQDKFVKGLAGRPVEIRRKAGWWREWAHDSAVVTGPGRHYIIAALTKHVRGDEYLEGMAAAVDSLLTDAAAPTGTTPQRR